MSSLSNFVFCNFSESGLCWIRSHLVDRTPAEQICATSFSGSSPRLNTGASPFYSVLKWPIKYTGLHVKIQLYADDTVPYVQAKTKVPFIDWFQEYKQTVCMFFSRLSSNSNQLVFLVDTENVQSSVSCSGESGFPAGCIRTLLVCLPCSTFGSVL